MGTLSNAARQLRADEDPRSDALAYWEYQESLPLAPAGEPAAEEMVSGWWILPVLVLSLPAWAAVLMAIF